VVSVLSTFRFGWREIWKIVQNETETTKRFSIGNTFRQTTTNARSDFLYLLRDDMNLGLRLNQDAIWKEINGNNNEISDGVSVLLILYTDWDKNQTIENIRQ